MAANNQGIAHFARNGRSYSFEAIRAKIIYGPTVKRGKFCESVVDELLVKMNGAALVIDPITDISETASSCTIRPLAGGEFIQIDDQGLIRALYDHPSATAYGEGSYTVRG